jgi:glycosyltransferase involved in cell wall biosynthesis
VCNRPLISVVVPTRNRQEVLAECLEALAGQGYSPYEVIVVDDCSADDTTQLLTRFAEAHPDLSFRWLVNEQNLGANASRNRAIREAQGELVAFLDSDSIAESDWLEKLAGGFDHENVAAVTGGVRDPTPMNIYELALKGINRVHGRKEAPRLTGCNMGIRRALLLQYPLDEDLKYGCDEEGIYLRLRAAGYRQHRVPDAIIRHEHHYTRRSFFRQAYVGGAAAAWLVYKYHLPPRLDLLPLILTYVTLPLILLGLPWALAPAFFGAAFLAAILYNERFRKRKTLYEVVIMLPVLLAYYHARLAGYVIQSGRLRLGPNQIERVRLATKR